jgi:hypothetical protein
MMRMVNMPIILKMGIIPSTYWKQLDSLLNKFKVKEHALKFGRLIIQDAGGRMKPINTSHLSYWEKWVMLISTKEWILIRYFLSMSQYAQFWLKPFNLFKKWKWQYRKLIGRCKGGNSSIYCIFDEKGNYKLSLFRWC